MIQIHNDSCATVSAVAERKQPPGEVLGGSVGFMLSKLGFHSASQFAAELDPLGIHPGHFAMLRMIAAAGGMSQQALAEMLQLPASRMVGLVDELQDRGLVQRRRSADDRRVNALHLTAAGRRLLQQATKIASTWEDHLCGSLDEGERETLLALLQRLALDLDLPLGVHPGLGRGRAPVG